MNYNLWELCIQSVNTARLLIQFQRERIASVAVAMAVAAVRVVSIIICRSLRLMRARSRLRNDALRCTSL